MFKIESYVTPILLSYVDKYVKDFKPADAQVSLWGGGVVLHNLVLKADVLQQEVALPFTLISGRIHELLIQVPWTKIMSEPIVVTIDTIECVLNLRKPTATESQAPEASRRPQVVEAPPGYMQALVRRIVSNIVLRVHHLIVKYVEDDIVLSLNVKYLIINCADGNWKPAFADIDQAAPVLRRLVQLEDFTLCLDRADSDGKIRFYQEPLLYRCQLNLRVMTRLISANTRRASALFLEIRSSKLAWGVSSDQLALLVRLLRERSSLPVRTPAPAPATAAVQPTAATNTDANAAEPAAAPDSWSEWAWSWLPSLKDQDDDAPEALMPAAPIPVHFQAYLDSVVLVYKIMELEGNKKRARVVLELCADYTALKGLIWTPTLMQTSFGIRTLTLKSHGKCVCGHLDMQTAAGEPTFYLTKIAATDDKEWRWPEVELEQEPFSPVADSYRQPFVGQTQVSTQNERVEPPLQEIPATEPPGPKQDPPISENAFWKKLQPVVMLQITHMRAPPLWATFNPYENPPVDFEYSDWNESFKLTVNVQPIECTLCMGLLHRFAAISDVFRDLPPPPANEQTFRTLTVEECEALLNNLPQRRTDVVCERIVVRMLPWDHSLTEKPTPPPIALDIDLPNITVMATGPLYPRRVCEAVCQYPNDNGPLCEGARLNMIGSIDDIQVKLTPLGQDATGTSRPVARTDLKFIFRVLLHQQLFQKRRSAILSSIKIQIDEFNVGGSFARLQAAWQVVCSLLRKKSSVLLKYTSLPFDATSDEDYVAVDLTVEDFSFKRYVAASVVTHLLSIQAARVTALHASGAHKEQPKQAWLFSGPDAPVPVPYLRFAMQLNQLGEREVVEFVGLRTEPTAAALDPLLVAFLSYRPEPQLPPEQPQVVVPRAVSSSAFLRFRNTPASSSGRGGSRSSSGAELVHSVRARSKDSSSEPEKPKLPAPTKSEPWNSDETLLWLHQRLSRLILSVDLGLVLLYVPLRSASAVDCVTVRDAMDRHASGHQKVLCVSLGRVNIRCSSMIRNLWKEIRQDGPTFGKATMGSDDDSFPWKMLVSDVSCYTISARPIVSQQTEGARGLKSQLKMGPVTPQTVLELVTTTVTLSVVTKKLALHAHPPEQRRSKETSTSNEKQKYFQTGIDFKPTTLKEFIRGPVSRKTNAEPQQKDAAEKSKSSKKEEAKQTAGPVVSLGVNIHADTPPLIVRLDHEQVSMVATAVHSVMHMVKLAKQRSFPAPKPDATPSEIFRTMRSVSESEEPHTSSETSHASENSELISIFESSLASSSSLKKFFWFQWVVSRGTVVVTSEEVKLALDVDDVITTLDFQEQYNQFKVKVAAASVKHYEKFDLEWVAGVLGGRILEAREPTSDREDNSFLSVTITQARIIDLPASWKEELHPKLLESKMGLEKDTIWEIYATLAPLEAVLQPIILENIIMLLEEVAPQTHCTIESEPAQSCKSLTKWPYLYVAAGGLRLLISSEDGEGYKDDTFIVQIGKIEVNPHPENPICRRRVTANPDSWATVGTGHEGRQYEMFVKDIAVLSTRFTQIISQEISQTNLLGTGGDNPALKWTQPMVPAPKLTPILHNMDINCVLAPAFFLGNNLACGPGLELNLTTDVSIELHLDQLVLSQRLATQLQSSVRAGLQYISSHSDQAPDEIGVCPYAVLIDSFKQDVESRVAQEESETSETDSELETKMSNHAADSGVETSASFTVFRKSEDKKTATAVFADAASRASEHQEIFVTMGIIELALYVIDDASAEIVALRPPGENNPRASASEEQNLQDLQEKKETKDHTMPTLFDEEMSAKPVKMSARATRTKEANATLAGADGSADKSVEALRQPKLEKANTELRTVVPYARRLAGMLPLLHVTLQQPNMYYWKKKTQKNTQLSLFNIWVGLGESESEELWNLPLVSTARGSPDPVTDIPPALATCKVMVPDTFGGVPTANALGNRGTVTLDVERPVLIEVSEDRLIRLKGIAALISSKLKLSKNELKRENVEFSASHKLYDLRRFFADRVIEKVTVQTGQIGVAGSLGALGWDSLSIQVSASARQDRLVARTLASALLVSVGPPGDQRHPLLHPIVIGAELEATWEPWRRTEGSAFAQEPTVQLLVDLDRFVVELKPDDLLVLARLQKIVDKIRKLDDKPAAALPSAMAGNRATFSGARASVSTSRPSVTMTSRPSLSTTRSSLCDQRPRRSRHSSVQSNDSVDNTEHYYKDDLRSGAFKMVSGGQLPMAYQVTMHEGTVSWKYPHPRAITRIIAFPLPDQNEEVRCVLEHFSLLLNRWEPHLYFRLPVSEPREIKLHCMPPDAQFSSMWRFRLCSQNEELPPYDFHTARFLPRSDPMVSDQKHEGTRRCPITSSVTAEQLSGIMRVDSYFSPRLMPRLRAAVRLVMMELHFHNSLPFVSSQVKELEGYYVSRPLMKSHRVLSCLARDTTVHFQLNSIAGARTLVRTYLSSQVLDCATGTIEQFIDEARFQGALSAPDCRKESARVRFRAAPVRAIVHVPTIRTFKALADDWLSAVQLCEYASSTSISSNQEQSTSVRQLEEVTAVELEGRVTLWIRNYCTLALRVEQEGTDQLLPIGPGAQLAYRWRCPTRPKRLRFARVTPSTDWNWSKSIPFTAGSSRLRLEDCEDPSCPEGGAPSSGLFLHTRVTSVGARRTLRLSGRLTLANMLRYHLLFKIRSRCPPNGWRTANAGELRPESVGNSVLVSAECDLVLKIKFVNHDTGWSGDIPLKECPKENVPWLVKVPSEGDVPYVAVWCRVVRGRSDGCILATIWPLYVLHSHLPLDIDVMISTERGADGGADARPPLVQTALGRGRGTHLLAPGTTAARHNLTFQYRSIDSPVTHEAVPLHYGVTSQSVFDRRVPVQVINEVIDDIETWLERSAIGCQSKWPYSIVTNHWPDVWRPALLQPRCDVTARYRAVVAGGGCSLELQLCPLVLLANAGPAALTLRAHDAAPLCKLEPGAALSPPSALLQKPFFLSLEVGRESFVSPELGVWHGEAGQYGSPPPRRAALLHPASIAILCGNEVALLTLYYEVKHEIHCLGLSNTYVLINRMNQELSVSAVVVPVSCEGESEKDIVLPPTSSKIIEPTKEGSIHGTPLGQFALLGRWHGEDASELRPYLGLALPVGPHRISAVVPIALRDAPVRRALSLRDVDGNPVAVVVTLQRHEHRWLVTVAPDPCPQLMVHNRTRRPLAVAQPSVGSDAHYTCVPDCPGIRWNCVVEPQMSALYSTPAHCARFPPAGPAPPLAYVTIGTYLDVKTGKQAVRDEDKTLAWCAPVALAAGEQLVQLAGGGTVKLRVWPYPHSSLLELRDVDQNDISASDIRRRLVGQFRSEDTATHEKLRFSIHKDFRETEIKDDNSDHPAVSDKYEALDDDEGDDFADDEDPDSVVSEGSLRNVEKTEKTEAAEDVVSSVTLKRTSKQVTVLEVPPSRTNESDAVPGTSKGQADGPSLALLETETEREQMKPGKSAGLPSMTEILSPVPSHVFGSTAPNSTVDLVEHERVQGMFDSLVLELGAASDTEPLLAIYADRAAVQLSSDGKATRITVSVAEVQVDNLQYDSGQYDFAVVASTCHQPLVPEPWGPIWSLFAEANAFEPHREEAHLLVSATRDRWTVLDQSYSEITELQLRLGPLALYVEDAYVSALVRLFRDAFPARELAAAEQALAEAATLQWPLRLRTLLVEPLHLTLTLHTAVRMYIALDQSPLSLSAFKLQDMMTSAERLTHALTVHYLSAAILGAGWVVGGLELLGAPGALAARVGGAGGGVRGVASAAAAALLRSLSAWAGSLARNLDLLAGDEEHARRAAAARRRPPTTFIDGLGTGITNFAVNMLGAVGGLAHHPLVGVAVGETGSGAAALRRGLLGALAKPLSATADLVAYAGHGLLHQTGWDPVPQPRVRSPGSEVRAGWQRDCVRWTFRLAELYALDGFEVLVDAAPLHLLLTHRYIVVAEPETERIVEMIDFRFCTLAPYEGPVIELIVTQNPKTKSKVSIAVEDEDELQQNAAAMARVARYTGAGAGAGAGAAAGGRALCLLPAPGRGLALHAALSALVRQNHPHHLPLI